jgi:transcriptional antiterminator NusG
MISSVNTDPHSPVDQSDAALPAQREDGEPSLDAEQQAGSTEATADTDNAAGTDVVGETGFQASSESVGGAVSDAGDSPVKAAAEEVAGGQQDEPVEESESAEPVDAKETEDDQAVGNVQPLELLDEESTEEDLEHQWYILKVQVNREESIRDALQRRVKIEGLDRFFGDIVVPTEDIAEFTKSGKRRVVKRKLYPGYIMVHMAINDDTWFVVRETPGIGDFTGSAGKPTAMETSEVERILNLGSADDEGESQIKTAIPYKPGDRVRVKEGYFQNFEGDVESVDEANGRVTVMTNIFGRSTPVELEHWQIESV